MSQQRDDGKVGSPQAPEVLSLNLETLDVAELERRIELSVSLFDGPDEYAACYIFDCGSYCDCNAACGTKTAAIGGTL